MNPDLILGETVRTGKRTPGAIYQGDAYSAYQHEERYDLVVLCAMRGEYELFSMKTGLALPAPRGYPRVVHAPNDDSECPLTGSQATIACQAARIVAKHYIDGKKILVSCMQGRNRSGLVSALAIVAITGMTGGEACAMVRERRKGAQALTNDHFVRFLERVRRKDKAA